MTQNVSPFSQSKLIWAMNEWSKCQTLDPFEREMVGKLKRAAEVSAATWWDLSEEMFDSHFYIPLLYEAISKARAAGFLRNWEGFQNV